MSDTVKVSLIVGVAAILSGFAFGGIYSVVNNPNGTTMIVNRFTGGGQFCYAHKCANLKTITPRDAEADTATVKP